MQLKNTLYQLIKNKLLRNHLAGAFLIILFYIYNMYDFKGISRVMLSMLFACFLAINVTAQIQPNTSHYMFNPQLNNPAFYGAKEGLNVGVNYRHQWAKLEGQPRTINIFADLNLPAAHGGIGFAITNDQLGAYNNTWLNVGYAFIQPIKDKLKISIGINAGFNFSQLDGSKLVTPQGTTGDLNDDNLSNQRQKSIKPNLAFGIAVIHKFVEVGINYNNLINAKDKFNGEIQVLKPKYGGVFQTYITGKVNIGKNFKLKPSVQLSSDFKEFQTDFSVLAGYKEYAYLGINVRGYNKKSFESLSPVINIIPVKNLNIIYSYDVNLNKLAKVNKGTHEVTLNYLLPNKKLYKSPKIINNPRFL